MAYVAHDIGADLVPYACHQNGTSLTDLVVVGYNYVTGRAFVYQNGVTTYLPVLPVAMPDAGFTSCAASISADGATIGGVCTDVTGTRRPVYWTGSGTSWTIHQLSEPVSYTGRFFTPYEPYGVSVSGNGSVFASGIGSALASSTPASFVRWSPSTPVLLGMGGEDLEATNVGISYTGNVIYAVRGVAPTWYISYWTAGVRAEVTVPAFPDNGIVTGPAAYAAANDGSRSVITAGYADDFHSEAPRAFYTDDTHTLVLLDLPVGASESRAFCCDSVCDNIAGHADTGAVLWVNTVPELLPALSGAATGNSYWAYGMNSDASLIVGVGNDASAVLKGIIWYSGTPTPTPPDTPTGQACNTPLVATSITASWSAATGSPTSYDFRWRLTSASGWTTITGITNLFYTVTGLTMGSAVEWQVRAVNAGGASAWSSSTSCPTMPPTCFGLCFECGPYEVCAPCDTFNMPEECS